MNAVKGIYHKGTVKLIDKAPTKNTSEVIVIFPEKEKTIIKAGGLFKAKSIDYKQIKKDLKLLSRKSEKHLLMEKSE